MIDKKRKECNGRLRFTLQRARSRQEAASDNMPFCARERAASFAFERHAREAVIAILLGVSILAISSVLLEKFVGGKLEFVFVSQNSFMGPLSSALSSISFF